MTAQEQQMIQDLTDRINHTQVAEKDADAERFLQSSLSRNPDAIYILAQTVLVQQYALNQAKQQLDQARQQIDQSRAEAAQQPKHSTSFLGNLLHLNDEPDRPAPPPPPRASTPQTQYAPVQNYGPVNPGSQGYAAQPAGATTFGGAAQPAQSGGFLRSALQTATGVAAGALAFQGIESLMHGFGGGGGGFGGGSGFGSFGGGNSGRPEEITNNYYGDSAQQGQGDLTDRLSPDVDDRRDSNASYADNSGNNDANDTNGLMDDNTTDNSSSLMDDSSSSDDSSDFGSSDDNSF